MSYNGGANERTDETTGSMVRMRASGIYKELETTGGAESAAAAGKRWRLAAWVTQSFPFPSLPPSSFLSLSPQLEYAGQEYKYEARVSQVTT